MGINSVQALFDMIPQYFKPEAAGETKVSAQFDIQGEKGGRWFVEIESGKLNVAQGDLSDPDFLVKVSAQDVLDMANGELDPLMAMARGKITIMGDMRRAIKLQSLFRIPSSFRGRI